MLDNTKPQTQKAKPMTTVGSICTGYGGLEIALTQAGINHRLAWYSEIDPNASKLLAHHHPDITNVGDITKVNPNDLTPVDIITAGFPCQDISLAGNREGIHGTKSGLWWTIRDTISVLRPSYVLLENIAAITTHDGGGHEVIASLTELRYDSRWTTIRASDVGACHGRNRWFCVAANTENNGL